MTIDRKIVFDAVRELLGRGFTAAEVAALDAAIDRALGETTTAGLRDQAAFFASVRAAFGALKQPQVDGFEALLAAMGKAGWPRAWTAYGLATAWHETAFTMQPVEEAFWKSDAWRKANLRYYPHHGRGYVQLTWPGNYERADRECGLGGRLIADPALAMDPAIAAEILVRGMAEGWFTGKKLADYLPTTGQATHAQYAAARRIINGTDKAGPIAMLALSFDAALELGGWA